jgi:hypothetical protein
VQARPGRGDPGASRRLGDDDPRTVLGVGHPRTGFGGDQARGGDVDRLEPSDLEDPIEPAGRQPGQAERDAPGHPD